MTFNGLDNFVNATHGKEKEISVTEIPKVCVLYM